MLGPPWLHRRVFLRCQPGQFVFLKDRGLSKTSLSSCPRRYRVVHDDDGDSNNVGDDDGDSNNGDNDDDDDDDGDSNNDDDDDEDDDGDDNNNGDNV